MTLDHWVVEALGEQRVAAALTEASRRRFYAALDLRCHDQVDDAEVGAVENALELAVIDLMNEEDSEERLRAASELAFQVARGLTLPSRPIDKAEWLVRIGCLATLGDRGADIRRLLLEEGIPDLCARGVDWGERVWSTVLEIWLRLLRKDGWADLDAVGERVVQLRQDQREFEPQYLSGVEAEGAASLAWSLIAEYHICKAAEVLGIFLCEGSSQGRFDIQQQLEAQFDRAVEACARGQLVGLETFSRLLARTSQAMVNNSIWAVTRAVNSRVTRFVQDVVSRAREKPIFEMLPPQRRTLREEGLLGSAHRSVVVSLPTSSGKTLIAEFRILQALNQFDSEQGWVAYLAPTRALVNQLAVNLRRDLGPLGVVVEKVSPALEVDGLEAGLLGDGDEETQFRVLVTTPEKLDLMLRGDWEEKIGRPLTLVVVDEAHNLGSERRGIKLELLLATINRQCRYAQFLLLTPFIGNAGEIARWLAPDSHAQVELAVDWRPNDRVIVVSEPRRGAKRGSFTLQLTTLHTSRDTLAIPESLTLPEERPLGLSWSEVSNGQSKLAAATAEVLRKRGTAIVLVRQPDHSWGAAEAFRSSGMGRRRQLSKDVESVRTFLAHELGSDYPLCELLEFGVGVHHSGMSHDARSLVEWLTAKQHLDILVATTTIAQGVNFPVSGVVLASHQYPYGKDMPPEDFWNIAGRAGRVDQGDLGIVALAAVDAEKARSLKEFIGRSAGVLNSRLVEMVQAAAVAGDLMQLELLAWQPAWSSFLQYLAHSYRQIGDHERFAAEVEQVLRGTLGFQALRRTHPNWAGDLINGVYAYAQRLKGKPLKLVDSTGFSWESVSATLGRLAEQRIGEDAWRSDLFGEGRRALQKMMGILLAVSELRENLVVATSSRTPDGDTLARMVTDWVQGRSLQEMATEYFGTVGGRELSSVESMTKCCQSVFGRLTQTASWGLAALQTLTFKDEFERLSDDEQRTLRNLPARVYYGVNSDEAVALRLLGVPRLAAEPLSHAIGVDARAPLSQTRRTLREAPGSMWVESMGELGTPYRRVWQIIEGEA